MEKDYSSSIKGLVKLDIIPKTHIIANTMYIQCSLALAKPIEAPSIHNIVEEVGLKLYIIQIYIKKLEHASLTRRSLNKSGQLSTRVLFVAMTMLPTNLLCSVALLALNSSSNLN